MQKKILLWFDVEDYLTVESDDALLELLKMLEESGVRSTLKFCTRKMELLHRRGRMDMIEKLAMSSASTPPTTASIRCPRSIWIRWVSRRGLGPSTTGRIPASSA